MNCTGCHTEIEQGRFPPVLLCSNCVVKTVYPDWKPARKRQGGLSQLRSIGT